MIDIDSYPVYIKQGSQLSFYHNSEEPYDDENFNSWRLHLVDCESFAVIVDSIASIDKDSIDESFFRWYSNIEWPVVLDGRYRLIVEDLASGNVKFISNVINVRSNIPDDVIYLRYRNSKNYLNIGYERLPTFYNRFYVKLENNRPSFSADLSGYTINNGSFQSVRSTLGRKKRMSTIKYNKEDHAAFNAATTHSEFTIIENGKFVRYKRDDSEYSINWSDSNPFNPLSDGQIELQRDENFKTGKTF